ncbi:MAG TPA: sigma-E factor negative regulatory protein [Burkholderiales bacterium]
MKEQVSAWMDGELDEREAERAFQLLKKTDSEAADTWRTYHLISDAMRDSRLLSAGFTSRVAARLQAEPTVLAPGGLTGKPVQRFALAAAASVAAVGLVGWLAFAPQREAPAPQPIAKAAPPAVTIVPLSSAANDYLLAHQGFSPRVMLQGMAPYVRTVSERSDEPRK